MRDFYGGDYDVAVEFIELYGYYSKLFGCTPNELRLNDEYIEVRWVNGKKYFYAKKEGAFKFHTEVDVMVKEHYDKICIYYDCMIFSSLVIRDKNDPEYSLKKSEDPFSMEESEFESSTHPETLVTPIETENPSRPQSPPETEAPETADVSAISPALAVISAGGFTAFAVTGRKKKKKE